MYKIKKLLRQTKLTIISKKKTNSNTNYANREGRAILMSLWQERVCSASQFDFSNLLDFNNCNL